MRKAENVFYPTAIQASDPPSTQAEVTPPTIELDQEVPPQNPLPPSQQKPAKEASVTEEASLDKAAVALEAKVASQGFQQDLTSTIMPAEGDAKDKERITPPGVEKPANQTSKLQIKLKK